MLTAQTQRQAAPVEVDKTTELAQMAQQVQQGKDMLAVKALLMRQVALLNQAVAEVVRLVLVRLAHPAQAATVV